MKNKTYKGIITKLPNNGIFVFGSNTQGRHGAGSARVALDYFGAKYGNPKGLQGQSYAIITTDLLKDSRPSYSFADIYKQIIELYNYANNNRDKDFYIIYSGEGSNLSGFSNEELSLLFSLKPIPKNIVFEEKFYKLIEDWKKLK